MSFITNAHDEIVSPPRAGILRAGNLVFGAQVIETLLLVTRVGDPERRVQIAQAAGALFDVRLLHTNRPAELLVTRSPLRHHGLQEAFGFTPRPEHGVVELAREAAEQIGVAGEVPRFTHRIARYQIGARH